MIEVIQIITISALGLAFIILLLALAREAVLAIVKFCLRKLNKIDLSKDDERIDI